MSVNDFTHFPMSWRPVRAELEGGPVYLALAAALERDIVSGRLPPGTRLPPQRELADFLDLNFTTVTRAFDLCREKNLIYGVTGRGTFVSSLPGSDEETSSPGADFGVVQGFPSIGARAVVAAAQKVLARDSAERLFSYSDREGRGRPREAGCRWFARAGVNVDIDHLAVFPGVQSVLSAALFSLFRVGEALAVDAFTYGNLIGLAHLARIRLVPIPGDDEGMLPDALADAVRRFRVKGLFVMPDCANPTTKTLSAARRDELAQIARRHELLILEDDAQLASGGQTLHSRLPEHTLYLAGSSRLVAPGLRATFVAFPEAIRSRLLTGLHHTAIKASALEAEILAELILNGDAEGILSKKRRAAQRANAVFNRVLDVRGPRADMRLFRTLPLPGTAGHGPDIERRFQEHGIRTFHSDRFHVGTVAGESFLRISVSNARSEKDLKAGLRLLGRFLPSGSRGGAIFGRMEGNCTEMK